MRYKTKTCCCSSFQSYFGFKCIAFSCQVSIELRKNKKDDMLSKRRNVGPEEDLALRLPSAISCSISPAKLLSPQIGAFFIISHVQYNMQCNVLCAYQ